MHEFAKKQKFLEINPISPLIEGLLRRVKNLPAEDEDRDLESEAELREVTSILIDGALIRSGFDVADSHLCVYQQKKDTLFNHSHRFFQRIDRVLRRSLGVSELAEADSHVAPAPPVDTRPIDAEDIKPRVEMPDHLKDQLEVELEEIPEDEDMYGNKISHDEL
jgi:heat shock protein beta